MAEQNKTAGKAANQGLADPVAAPWLGTCEECDTKREMGGGIAIRGRKYVYVLLMCEKCRYKTRHKFSIKNQSD